MNGSLKVDLNYLETVQVKDSLQWYVDKNYVENMNIKKYLLSFVFILFGAIISWKINK